MTVLVTGSTGLVGNNVVRLLLGEGRKVRVVVRPEYETRPLEGLDVEIVHGDVCDRESLHAAMQGVDLVIHSAGNVHIGWTGKERSEKVNVGGTKNIAEATREAGAKLVHVSSVDALGAGLHNKAADEETIYVQNPPIPYVVTKAAAEVEVRRQIERGLHAVIINPGYMLGPWDWKPSSGRMLLEVVKGKPIMAPRGGTTVCDVRDVATGIVAAAEKGRCGANYILGGENMTYLELWKQFAEVAGNIKPICRMGPLIAIGAGVVGDIWSKVSGTEGGVNSAALQMSSVYHYYSSRRAEEELGYQVRPASQSIVDAWEWFRSHGYVKNLSPEKERKKSPPVMTEA
ncbi:NAD-dependent epimerase/dehydratase family protein [Blastopirellula sp. JC732]|uniref:NAD-dependent epimerase/dehydratase family protein n=1 Tax=Blastopirellula sediminis TaxID=2894196 RepID=A0A9X1MPP1_9BACT|nr:NAD-dependent epimerase/dehydratase family protein [Blastopirellula sediminis]MCC9606550.1 NAD-dependent epimerase/dehydratase family protein [Blastopirellula sediminis]MCC9630152.1 NAD-dependent epimerase/dehydratase family protein [Blastopirellula sediminis]